MQELGNIAIFIQEYVSAIRKGFENTVALLPGLIEQHIETQAREKLHSSRETYLSAVKVSIENYVIIVEMDEDNWLACAVEQGASAWDMNNPPGGGGHLNSSKAKISKEGYKYMRVPMGKEAGGKAGPSERSKMIQEKINAVMKRPQIGGPSKYYTQFGSRMKAGIYPGGKIVESQEIKTDDPDISGMYRQRTFANAAEFNQKKGNSKGMPKWALTMFRTISENPASKHWQHPGITGVEIFKDTERWMNMTIEKFLEKQIETEIAKITQKFQLNGGV
jgi:hypothetical protein